MSEVNPTTSSSEQDFERNNVFVSIKRTLIPVLVGSILAGLTALGLDVDPEALLSVLTGIYSSAYYLLARYLEAKNPLFGKILLGNEAQPLYLERPKA